MELKDFVTQTLVQIAQGVAAAQGTVRSAGGFVNPTAHVAGGATRHFGHLPGNDQHVFLVDFDVGVTVNESLGTNAEAKLQVANFIKIGASANTAESQQTVNQIRFSVPIALPVDPESTKLMDAAKRKTQESVDRANASFRGRV